MEKGEGLRRRVREMIRKGVVPSPEPERETGIEEEGKTDVRVIYEPSRVISTKKEITAYGIMIRDRLEKTRKLVRGINIFDNIKTMSQLKGDIDEKETKKRYRAKREILYTMGVLLDKKYLNQGFYDIILEDDTGALVVTTPPQLLRKVARLMPDEVIIAQVMYDRLKRRYFAIDVETAGREIKHKQFSGSSTKKYAIFLSDLHCNEENNACELFDKFITWLLEDGMDRYLKRMVKYFIITGDLIDCEVQDPQYNYGIITKNLSRLPDNIAKIIIPGECDITGSFLPQSPIKRVYRRTFEEIPNTYMLGNPVTVTISGVKTLLYHGQSLPCIMSSIGARRPVEAQKRIVETRSIAPLITCRDYTVSPEEYDLTLLDILPDIVHSGHVHMIDALREGNLLYLVTPSWTDDLLPKVAIVDLSTLNTVWRCLA